MRFCLLNYKRGLNSFVTKRWTSSNRPIQKLLIANRGEIACRVIGTARKLGVKTVAVYSDADKNALHVEMADEAYNIGPPPVSQSYLRGDKLIEIAKRASCQAIHPGYGFLSENVEFAESCQKSGVIFIGPPASAIRDMGIKSTSKLIMSKAGVPVVKGYHGDDQSISRLKSEALKIGFPVMIKAVRGGGGKGMRIAHNADEFEAALESAKTESQKAFGDSVVLLEQFIAEPRHVEVQVFGDMHGNVVHLFERDCSVQRRHQKIIEEAPAPALPDNLRRELGEAAVRAAKAVGYVGAGTVEFILDRKTLNFHFMEMNTRLQVEHPITEMVTGTDLVEWQIKIAAGEKLPVEQDRIEVDGHSFEARIYAEDPRGGFLPGTGVLSYLATPSSGPDVRIETGVREGDEVSVHYDPMIAKLVVWGRNRLEALQKLEAKLLEYNIAGLETNVNFLLELTRHSEFVSGNVHTNFIRDNEKTLFSVEDIDDTTLIQAAVLMILKEQEQYLLESSEKKDQFNPFVLESGYSINYNLIRDIKLKNKAKEFVVKVRFDETRNFAISLNNGSSWIEVQGKSINSAKKKLQCTINGVKTTFAGFYNNDILAIFNQKGKTQFTLDQPKFLTELDELISSGSSQKAVAPMPGILDKILVKVGDRVQKGDSLFVLIAMKMENVVKAARDAVVAEVYYKSGDSVAKDAAVVRFEDE